MPAVQAEANERIQTPIEMALQSMLAVVKTPTGSASSSGKQDLPDTEQKRTPPQIQKPLPKTPKPPASWPNCTHTTMLRKHGNLTCCLCGRVPSIGWLYVCGHDRAQQQSSPPPKRSVSGTNTTRQLIFGQLNQFKWDDEAKRADLVEELSYLGFHQSVIEGAKKGTYTIEQMKKVILQKRAVQSIMILQNSLKRMQELSQSSSESTTYKMPGSFNLTPPTTPKKGPPPNGSAESAGGSEEKKGGASSAGDAQPPTQGCSFQACHHCRPYYKDRCFVTFEAVYQNEQEPLTEEEAVTLPWHDASLLHHMGLRMSARRPSATASMEMSSRGDGSSNSGRSEASCRPSVRETCEDEEAGTGIELQGDGTTVDEPQAKGLSTKSQHKRAHTDVSAPDCTTLEADQSTVTLPLPGTGALRDTDEAVEDFDLSLFRAMPRSRTAFVPLAGNEGGVPLYSGECAEAENETDEASGEEIEVDGGVALTEEAVELHIPDIVMKDA